MEIFWGTNVGMHNIPKQKYVLFLDCIYGICCILRYDQLVQIRDLCWYCDSASDEALVSLGNIFLSHSIVFPFFLLNFYGLYNSIFSIFPKDDFSEKKLILKLQSLHFLINRYFWPPRVSCILTFCTVSSWRCCAMIKERYIATGSQETSGQISTEFLDCAGNISESWIFYFASEFNCNKLPKRWYVARKNILQRTREML